MKNQLELYKKIRDNGIDRDDRTGVGSRFINGETLKFDLSAGFPIATTRRVSFRIAFEETMMFLRGETNTKTLEDKKINIWRGNTTREFLDNVGLEDLPVGSIGTGYSHQWRNFGGFPKITPIIPGVDAVAQTVLNAGALGKKGDKASRKGSWKFRLWLKILKRCYDKTDPLYYAYGAINVSVSPRWLVYDNFAKDLKKVYGYRKGTNLTHSLSHDVYETGCFSLSTCEWVSNYNNRIPTAKYVRRYAGVDQLSELIDGLRNNPTDRRHIISGWNPKQLKGTPLPPCHLMQMYTVDQVNNRLNSCFIMRSSDQVYGNPYNLMSYAFINAALAKLLGYESGELTGFYWDCHVYKNQLELLDAQVERTPFELPKIVIKREISSMDDLLKLEFTDIEIVGYESHPDFDNKPPMAV